MARSPWVPPAYHPGELDRALLHLCAPEPLLPPLWVNPEPLLARAVELDVFPLVFHRLRHSPRWPRTLPDCRLQASPKLRVPGKVRGWLPGGVSPEWEERFRSNAARNLLLETEQERILRSLRAAGVGALPLKGTRLAARLYADLALRAQVDVDLYVAPEQLPTALGALEADGYRRRTAVGLPAERLAATGDEFTSECSLEKFGRPMPILVELHWRLLPLPAKDLLSAGEKGGLPEELDFLYLCVQASADRWGTLKTLVDLAHWVRQQPPDWEKLAAAAERLGLARVLSVTLQVLLHYFDLQIPEWVPARLTPAVSQALPRAAVANPFVPAPPLSPAATHRLRWALRERFRDRLRYAVYLLRPTASDLAVVSLPRGLGFLYWGVRWVRLSGLVGPAEKPEPSPVRGGRSKLRWPRWETWRQADWGVLARCLWLIPAVEWSVRWLSPQHWLPPLPATEETPARDSRTTAQAAEVARWVDAAYRRSPFSPSCLTRSLVLYRLLRARRLPCRLQLGLRKADSELQGHAWVQSGKPVADTDEFEVVLSF